jgi:hypothetical protein
MKRINLIYSIIIGLVVILPTSNSFGQSGWKIGVVGGEDFANAQTLPSLFQGITAQGTSGYILGIRSDAGLVPMFSLQTELLVSERSFQLPSGSTRSWAESLTYLQIPILLKFSPLPGAVQPYAYLGPDIGFRLSASLDSNSSSGINASSLFNSVDLDLDAGLGIQFEILPVLWIFAEGRYTYGLVNVYNNVQAGSSLGDLRSRDFKWLAGIMLGF